MKRYIVIVLLTLALGWFVVQDTQANRGDLNHDGKTNVLDLSLFSEHYQR